MSHVTNGTGRRSRRSVDSAIAPNISPRRRVAPIYLLALLLISLFAWAPLLYPGYFQLRTGFQPLINLADLTSSPEFIRWAPPLSQNAGLLQSEGPLAYWMAWSIQPLLGGIGAIKAVLALSFILGGIGMFWWTRLVARSDRDSGREVAARAGLLAAVVYMLWPPLLVNTYVVGGFGTALFLGLLPWAFAAITSTKLLLDKTARSKGNGGRFAPLSRILFVVVIATMLTFANATLGLIALPLLIVWTLWPPTNWASRLTAGVAVLVGAIWAVDLIWLFGAGGEVRQFFAALDIERFLAFSIHPYQLLSPVWGFGSNTPDWQDGISMQLGLVALGLAVLTVVFSAGRPRDAGTGASEAPARPGSWYAVLFSTIGSLVFVFMASTLARPLWRLVPQLASLLSYPSDLLALVAPLLALLAGLVVHVERRMAVLPVWAGIVTLVVLGSYTYLAPRTTLVEPDMAVVADFGDGMVSLLRADVPPLTPTLSQGERGPEDTSAISPLPLGAGSDLSLPEGEGRGEGSDLPLPEGEAQGEGSDLPLPGGEGRGEGEIIAGNALTVTLVWQPLRAPDFDYNVFIHGFDARGNRIAQWDGQPMRDGQEAPMTGWQAGDVVSGDYVLHVDGGRPITDVSTLWVGLYDWQTGDRLPVNGDDKVIVDLSAQTAAEDGS